MNHCASPLFWTKFFTPNVVFCRRLTLLHCDTQFLNLIWICLTEKILKIGFIFFAKTFNNFIVHLFVFLWHLNCENEFSSKIFIFTNGFYKIIHTSVIPLSSSTSAVLSLANRSLDLSSYFCVTELRSSIEPPFFCFYGSNMGSLNHFR